MTNVSASAYADMPLFLFHLLEYMDVDYEIDVDDINRRWSEHDATDVWSQLVLKEPDDGVELLTATPATGIWRLEGGGQHRLQSLGQRLAQPAGRRRGLLPARARSRATTATRAPTSASWSPAVVCRPRTTS